MVLKGQSRQLPRTFYRLARILLVTLLIIILLPYLLVPLYRFVDPVSTLMLWRWITGARVTRTVLPIARMAPVLPAAVVAAEDGRFCAHHGVDWRQIREALEESEE